MGTPFQGDIMAHALSKACGKATYHSVGLGLDSPINLKKAHNELHACVTYTKKSSVGARKLTEAQKHFNVPPTRLSTAVKTRFAAQFKFYNDMLVNKMPVNYMFVSTQVAEKFQHRVPSQHTWAIARTIVDTLGYPSIVCVKAQDRGHWLLADALSRVSLLVTSYERERKQTVAEVRHVFLLSMYDTHIIFGP
jgi:hypothetical protein